MTDEQPISRTVVALTVEEARMLLDWADRAVNAHLSDGASDLPDGLLALLARLERDLPDTEAKP